MQKKWVFLGLGVALMMTPLASLAQTPPSSHSTVDKMSPAEKKAYYRHRYHHHYYHRHHYHHMMKPAATPTPMDSPSPTPMMTPTPSPT